MVFIVILESQGKAYSSFWSTCWQQLLLFDPSTTATSYWYVVSSHTTKLLPMTNHVSIEYIMYKTLYWLQSSFLELVLSLVQSQVNLIHLMVHFPKLISLMLVWGLHRSPALFSIPETFTCPIGFWWMCNKVYSGGLNRLLPYNIVLDLHLRNSWPLDGVMLQFLHCAEGYSTYGLTLVMNKYHQQC